MIRSVLLLWVLPVTLFWGWYFLSLNDMNFGVWFLTREMNELVFAIYGDVLGIDPATIPPLVAKALAIDSLIVLGLVSLRKRRAIAAWIAARRRSGEAALPAE